MLRDPDVEAIIVATSDAFHVPMTLKALEAGKPVLCEKPLGVNVEEVEQLALVVARTGLTLQVGAGAAWLLGLALVRRRRAKRT